MKRIIIALIFSILLLGCAPSAPEEPAAPTYDSVGEPAEPTPVPSVQETQRVDETGNLVEQPGNFRSIEMRAYRFAFEPDPVRVRLGETVELNIISEDVTHGIAIPAFGVDERLPPGEVVTITFVADRKGTFPFSCSIFCGTGHNGMGGELIVE